jgi:hypothetical protein
VGGRPQNDDPLALDRETMREQGYRAVDLLVDRLLADGPPLRRATAAEMQERLAGPPPDGPQPLEDVLARLERDVLPFRSRVDHPRFLAFISGSGTWPGAVADFVASACNVYAGSWMESAGPSQVELEVLGWFKDWIGYPSGAAGSLTSGGSAANMTALACAREANAGAMREDLVLYVSDQAHSSIARAARILGFRPDQVRVLPTDERLRLIGNARRGDRGRCARGPLAAGADRERGRDEHRRGRPACRPGRGVQPVRRLAARRRGLRRLRRPHRAAAPSFKGWRSPTRSRSTRTSGSTSRSSAAACSSEMDASCGTPSSSPRTTSPTRKPPKRRPTSAISGCS